MNIYGYLFYAFLGTAIVAILAAWWQKFVRNRPEVYGKGRGHDPRGPERAQWDRIPTRALRDEMRKK